MLLERLRQHPIFVALFAALISVAFIVLIISKPGVMTPAAPPAQPLSLSPQSSDSQPGETANTSLNADTAPSATSPENSGSASEEVPVEPSPAPQEPVGQDESGLNSTPVPVEEQTSTPSETEGSSSSPFVSNPKSLPLTGGYVPETKPEAPVSIAQPVGALYQRQQLGTSTSDSFTPVTALPSNTQVVDIIHQVFPQEEWSRAERIASCESGMRSVSSQANTNGSRDHGIYQLNDGGTLQNLLRQTGQDPSNTAKALDASWNVQAAHLLWKQRGWQPWACAGRLGITDGIFSGNPGPNW